MTDVPAAGPAAPGDEPSRLADFIFANIEPIMAEWEAFAASLAVGYEMTPEALRNDAERMLRFIATDIQTAQSDVQQDAKAKGRGKALPHDANSAAHDHGLHRLAEGFSLVQMISEYRALRASVTRLWLANVGATSTQMQELIRFNEAMDQILAESVARFTSKLDRDKDLFLAILGHDLRNPLNAVTLSAAALKRSTSLTSNEHAIAQRIAASGRRMSHMVSDLLDFTRTRLGAHLPLRQETCNLEHLVRQVADEIGVAHPDRTLEIIVEGESTGLWDCNRVTQLVSNLAGNAVKHGYPGSGITLAIRADRDAVELDVVNHGPGIAAEEQAAIFDPLRRGSNVSAAVDADGSGSLGLGLYITREIATAHGGWVKLVSSGSEETTFRVWLPRRPPPPSGPLRQSE